MVSCDVICDLMVVYASGEASPETQRLVEEHLARCPACREAFGREQAVDEALAALEPEAGPSNGRRFIARTRRLVFAIGAGALALFACVLTGLERVVMEGIADITLARLPGPAFFWLVVATGMVGLYAALLLWRRGRGSESPGAMLLLSLVTFVPLSTAMVALYHLAGTGAAVSVALAGVLLLVVLGLTFALLPRLPYVVVTTLLVLLLVNGLLLVRALAGVVALGDYSWQTPAQLGRPPDELTVEEAAQVDLTPLGLTWVESTEAMWVDQVWVGPQATAVTAVYEGQGLQAFLTLAGFPNPQAAGDFFASWREAASGGVQIAHFEINLPGLPGQGRIWRSYDAQRGKAYSAWQSGDWVIIIEVPGPISQAMPLAREIKAAVAEAYGQ
ncbi:MAG: anti-sigma factor family protein [Anaerolineae bacterium]